MQKLIIAVRQDAGSILLQNLLPINDDDESNAEIIQICQCNDHCFYTVVTIPKLYFWGPGLTWNNYGKMGRLNRSQKPQ